MRDQIIKFMSSKKQFPFWAALASGLYPLIYYFGKNFNFVNSWQHLIYFSLFFVVIPIVVFKVVYALTRGSLFESIKDCVLPFLNSFTFLFLIQLCVFARISIKYTIVIILVSFLLSWFFYKVLNKLIVLQLLLACIGLFSLGTTMTNYFSYSEAWLDQPDDIEKVVFKKSPNVYYIQPDGYANPSELKKGYYKIDNSGFESYLDDKNFKTYLDFRSNYEATLASNSSIFSMKHHYYSGFGSGNEVAHARRIITSENAVLNIFKANNYKTYFLTEFPYLMINRPKMGYDICNFSYSDIPFIGDGLQTKKDVVPAFKSYLNEDISQPKFFFIEIFNPKHISHNIKGENIHQRHKEAYVNDLDAANTTLKELIDTINKNDKDALIIIMADHGGYLGLKTIQEGNEKTTDRDKIYSIFSSMLSIKWPDSNSFNAEKELKSAVNLFRFVFSYLSEDSKYLDYLDNDSSYGVIKKGAPKGVYEFIDEAGEVSQKEIRLLD